MSHSSRPPAVPNLAQEAQQIGASVTSAPIVNVIESNRAIAIREYPEQIDKNYEWTTMVKPAIQIKKDDAIMVSNVFINQRGSSSDVLDFTSLDGNINQNSKTKAIFSMYVTDDGTTGKRRQIDITGLVPYVFNQVNTYTSMKVERYVESCLQIYGVDYTEQNKQLWLDYFGIYSSMLYTDANSILIPRQDPYCDNRWFNTMGREINDYGDSTWNYILSSGFSDYKVSGWRYKDGATNLTIERKIGDTDESHNPALFIKQGDTFLFEVLPSGIADAVLMGFPINQYLTCTNSDVTNASIQVLSPICDSSIYVNEVRVFPQAITGTPTLTVENPSNAFNNKKYLVQYGGTQVITNPAINYKIVSLVGTTLTVDNNFVANLGDTILAVQPFAPIRDAVANTDSPPFSFRLVNTGMAGMDSLPATADGSRGWNMKNLMDVGDEVYEYRVERKNAGTGFGDNINTFNEFLTSVDNNKPMGVVTGFTKTQSTQKAYYYNLTGNNPITGFTKAPNLTIVNVVGSINENILNNPNTSRGNIWGCPATYTSTQMPFLGILTTRDIQMTKAINPMTGSLFKNYEGIWFDDYRDHPTYIFRLNIDNKIELYDYNTYSLRFTLNTTMTDAFNYFTAHYGSAEDVVKDQARYKESFWSNNTTLEGKTTTAIDNLTTYGFTAELDAASVWKSVDYVFRTDSRVLNIRGRLMFRLTDPTGVNSEIFYLQSGSYDPNNHYPKELEMANFSTIVRPTMKGFTTTNMLRSFESRTGNGIYPVGSTITIMSPTYHASPIIKILGVSYNLFGKNNQKGTIISTQPPQFVELNWERYCRNWAFASGNGVFNARNVASYVRTHSTPHSEWVDHLISHTIDLGDATNLSPSDVGSIITKEFQDKDDLRISNEIVGHLNTKIRPRLNGLQIKNSSTQALFMNKFYQPCWDAYEDDTNGSFAEDSTNFNGRATGTPTPGGFRFKIRYDKVPVFHNRNASAYQPNDGYYYDIDHPNYPAKTDGDPNTGYWTGDFIVYVRSGNTGLNVVPDSQKDDYRNGTMTATPTGSISYGNVNIGMPVKSGSYPVVITNTDTWEIKSGFMCGSSSATLNFNVDFSRFEWMLFHQPYVNPVKTLPDGGGVEGGEPSSFIIYPLIDVFKTGEKKQVSPYTEAVWGRFSGINTENWATLPRTFDNYRDFFNYYGDYNPLDLSKLDDAGVRFMKKIGYTDDYITQVGWGGGRDTSTSLSISRFYEPKSTTNNAVDISNAFIPSSEAPTNNPIPNQTTSGTNAVTIPESFQQGSYGGLSSGWGFTPGAGAKYDQLMSLNNNHLGGNLPNTAGEPLIYNPRVSGTFNDEPDFNPDCRIFQGYVIDADTGSMMAKLLPEKNNSPYYLLLCPEIAGSNNFYSTRANGSVSPNVCSIISRLNAEQDFVFSYQSPITFYAKQDIILSSITCKILMPDYSAPTSLSSNSSVIFQVVRTQPQPPYIQPTFGQLQQEGYAQLTQLEATMRHLMGEQHQGKRDAVSEISNMLADAGFHPSANTEASLLTRVSDIATQAGLNNMNPVQLRNFMRSQPMAAELIAKLGQIRQMAANVPPVSTPTSDDIQDPGQAVLNLPFEQVSPDDPEYAMAGQPVATKGDDDDDADSAFSMSQVSSAIPPSMMGGGIAPPTAPSMSASEMAGQDIRLSEVEAPPTPTARQRAELNSQQRVNEMKQRMLMMRGAALSTRDDYDRLLKRQDLVEERWRQSDEKGDTFQKMNFGFELSEIRQRLSEYHDLHTQAGLVHPDLAGVPHHTLADNVELQTALGGNPMASESTQPRQEEPEQEPPDVGDPGSITIRGRRVVDENNREFREPDLVVPQVDTSAGGGRNTYFRATRIPAGGYGTAETFEGHPTFDPAVHGFPGTLGTDQLNRLYYGESVYAADSEEAAHRFILEAMRPIREGGRPQNRRLYDIHKIDATGLDVTAIVGNPLAVDITERFAANDRPLVLNPKSRQAVRERSEAYVGTGLGTPKEGMVDLNREHLVRGPVIPQRVEHVRRLDYRDNVDGDYPDADDPTEHPHYERVYNAITRHRDALTNQQITLSTRDENLKAGVESSVQS